MGKLYESLMTRAEVAEALKVSQKTIDRMEKRGFIPRAKGGRVPVNETGARYTNI